MPVNSVRDVVLYTRVRLARNFADIPFPSAMNGEEGEKAQLRAAQALAHAPEGKDFALLRVHDMPDAQRRMLVEQHLISRELLTAGESAAVLLRRDECVSILINEDDHLRIHALLPGNRLQEAAQLAFEIDDAVGREVQYAYDAEFGFLTSCPTNTGTGMRASALLHLPAMSRTSQIGALVQELAKLGVSLRPLYGEGGEAHGDLYLLGNQVALGRSEQELLDSISAVLDEIVQRERMAREMLLLESDSSLEDRLMRSLGALQYARMLPEAEWMRRWSDVRLAIQAGLVHMSLDELDALLDSAKPAHLEMVAGRGLTPAERDEHRAQLVRDVLCS